MRKRTLKVNSKWYEKGEDKDQVDSALEAALPLFEKLSELISAEIEQSRSKMESEKSVDHFNRMSLVDTQLGKIIGLKLIQDVYLPKRKEKANQAEDK